MVTDRPYRVTSTYVSLGSNGLNTEVRTILNKGNLTLVLLTLGPLTLNINDGKHYIDKH
jgi:hypothetical protein